MKKLVLALALLVAFPAWAQQGPGQIVGGVYNASPATLADKQSTSLQLDSAGSLIVSGSFSASFTNFTPTGAASLAVSNVTGRVALPNTDATVILQNTGTTNLFFKLGSVAVNAATTDYSLPAGYSIAVKITTEAYVAAITAASTTTLKVIQGTGTPSMTGGGGSGGGGGSLSATATALDPSYVEGSDDALSMDLSGYQRTILPTSQLLVTGTPGASSPNVVSVQGIAAGTAVPISAASASIASGAVASGAVASGAYAAGSISAGAIAAGATSLVKLEDVASAGGDAGVPAMAIQKATPADTAAADDYSMLQMSAGRLWTSTNVQSATTGGCTPYHFVSTASTNAQAIKAGAAGTLCAISAINTTATIAFLRIYDAAAAPTCSSATGAAHSYPIPPYSAAGSAGGLVVATGPFGEAFTAGIAYCMTGGGADTDNTNAPAGVYINASYK